ncbi:hypothetical protein OY671_008228, partial [Metschnikowia pulcherrima]
GLAAVRAGRRLGIPVVYEIRAFWEDAAVGNGTGREGSPRYWSTRRLENRVVAGADAVVTICRGSSEDSAARGVARDRSSIMPNGVDSTMFGQAQPRDPASAEASGSGDGPVIGFLGSFYPYEGSDDSIAAMPAIVAGVRGARSSSVGGVVAAMTASQPVSAGSGNVNSSIFFVGVVAATVFAGVPIAFAHGKHYTFELIPETTLGFTSGTQKGTNGVADTNFSGFLWDIGARVGAEIHFGFIGVPELALEGGIGLYFRRETYKVKQDPNSSSDGTSTFATSLQGNPWALFSNQVSAIYYF